MTGTSLRKTKKKRDEAEVDPRFAPVVAAFANDRRVGRKKMFSSNAVLTVNGRIFAMVVKGKLVVKLPKERADQLVRDGDGKYFDPGHGRLMKEWVAVPSGRSHWVQLSREAYHFVKGVRQ